MISKIIITCVIFVLGWSFPFSSQPKNIYAESLNENTYFARIINDTCALYGAPDESSAIFFLPKTYFVELTSQTDNFYYARYDDLYGYVKKDEVLPVVGTPSSPFLINKSFRVFVPSGANLRSSPENLGSVNLVYSVPFLETNLKYYGTIDGEEAISKKGTTWYYCKYYVNNLSYTGYVYKPLCDELGTIPENAEILEPYEGELIFDSTIETSGNSMQGLSSTTQVIIIVIASLPCLLFIYLLFRPTHIAESSQTTSSKRSAHSKKQKIRRLKKSDYFEIDDDFN